MKLNAIPYFILSLLIIIADQISKWWVLNNLTEQITLTPWLNIIFTQNTGVAFGFLNNTQGWSNTVFSVFALIVSVILVIWIRRLEKNETLIALALSLILGGALGNLIDRLWHGYVIDFIDFHINAWHFATFNIADSGISVGVTILIINLIWQKK
ncbi:MAG: signal peptidase II [Gammaproteobacteria bacterium]